MTLKSIMKYLRKQLKRILGVGNYDRIAESRVRKMYALYAKGGRWNKFRALRLCNQIRKKYSIYVYPTSIVGENLYIAHCVGIVIGKTAVIGDNCRIYPNVHIASSRTRGAKMGDRRHAKIGANCTLCINATILGAITIGDNVIIGANALVTKDVPSNSVVVGVNQIRPLRGDEMNFKE